MLSKPFPIAIILTLLCAIPLYLLSSNDYVLTQQSLPLPLLTLFVITLISSYWGSIGAKHLPRSGGSESNSAFRESGSVKWFNASKGFGFITRDSGEDVFVHFRSIRGEGHRVLRDGQRVEFEVTEGDKGLQAEDVALTT